MFKYLDEKKEIIEKKRKFQQQLVFFTNIYL